MKIETLVLSPPSPSASTSENQSTPIVLMNDTTSKVDVPELSLTPSTTPLEKNLRYQFFFGE